MREIKFRAWDEERERMIYFEALRAVWFYQDGYRIQGDETEESAGDRDFTAHDDHRDKEPLVKLMEYTGLKDKNGVEIYEGDIVPITTWEETSYEWIEDVSKNYVIKFISGGFALHKDGVKPYGSWYWLHDRAHTIEVIGNIYENPELLETK